MLEKLSISCKMYASVYAVWGLTKNIVIDVNSSLKFTDVEVVLSCHAVQNRFRNRTTYLPTITTWKWHVAVFPALSDAVIVTLCSPHVNSLPFILFVPNKWTPTLSVTVTPGKNIFVNFSLDVLRMSSGHFAILGGSRSARVFFSDRKRKTGFYATLCTSFSSRSSKFAITYMALLTLLILAVCSNTWSY